MNKSVLMGIDPGPGEVDVLVNPPPEVLRQCTIAPGMGILFLDEVGEIPPSTQVKLLRVLQEGEFQRVGGTDTIKVSVRIVGATNQILEELISQGRFRKDLYYRLSVVPVMVPALRERAEDIPLLVSHFIEKRNPDLNKQITGLSPQAMSLLMAYGWPGNVRELENVIQRTMVVAKGDTLDVQDLPPEISGKDAPREKAKDLKGITRESAGLAEKSFILDALAKSGGNVTQAARSLGISRVTLQLHKGGQDPPQLRNTTHSR